MGARRAEYARGVTHEYTLLLGATVLPGGDAPACGAVAWAGDTILALGTDAEVRAISRGDSHVLTFPGAFVAPTGSRLEVGGQADLQVLGHDPRLEPGAGAAGRPIAVVRAGRLVEPGA